MRPLSIAACLALATATFVAFAQDPEAEAAVSPAAAEPAPPATPAAPATATADLERGRSLTYTCHGCHGVRGYENAYPTYRVPKLGGQSEAYLFNALQAYRTGDRQHPTMEAQAQSFTEADLADIAAFLASLQP